MGENKIPVALQLYSLRDIIADDVRGTLETVADMGYEGVEFAGYYGLAPAQLRKVLDDCGLVCAGSHTGLPMLTNDTIDGTVEMNRVLGTERMIIPGGLPMHKETDEAVEMAMDIYRRCKAAGMRTGFHNHMAEFSLIDGRTQLDRLFESTPDDFLVQCDIGWATAAGADVPAFLRKYADRLETVHLKEHNENVPTAPVGEGAVNWPDLFDILEKETKVQWYIVEQERYATDSLTSVRDCIDNIRKMGR